MGAPHLLLHLIPHFIGTLTLTLNLRWRVGIPSSRTQSMVGLTPHPTQQYNSHNVNTVASGRIAMLKKQMFL